MILDAVQGISMDRTTELFQWISAYAMELIVQMGGTRAVEQLVIAGFVLGFLACLFKIKHIEG